ncbi:SIS domain-containing protein [Rouxiella sp. S1S-2]|uniref:6-phospho-3-hexuloisomerase n=1 Tax=Rouxiella sp. S1S-2 TaxID=2653856 RepID=UPI001263FEAF|nr:6-phospho-3-hexuloisomerase [Rouxiella sp. S1S-2]KAB7896338.1 SIS domain-containing protein [Rouxiella sp. S1S-2]
MSIRQLTQQILSELTYNSQYIEDAELESLVTAIRQAKHIFLAGAGRSGIGIRGLANRLMHLGFSVSLVGEISSPHTKAGDLLIVASGSGETGSLVSLANKAKSATVSIATVTMDRESSIARLADVVVMLPGVSPKLKNQGIDITSIQPMGSAFEQLCFLVYDAVVLSLMAEMGETSERMFTRHADLE